MTTLCPPLDGSAALLAELRGDPRYSEPDVPPPRLLERHRNLVRAAYCNASPCSPEQDETP